MYTDSMEDIPGGMVQLYLAARWFSTSIGT